MITAEQWANLKTKVAALERELRISPNISAFNSSEAFIGLGEALKAGSNVTLTKSGRFIVVAASGGGGGGSVATDTIWDAKGDLAVGTGADAASRLAVGANDSILMADSATGTGLKWAPAATTSEIADIAPTESAGTSDSYARGDHVHAAPHSGINTTGMKATLALMAASGRPAATAGCARGSAETTTNKVNYDTLDFDQSTQEHASWAIIMPDNYDPAVDMTARFLWTTAASSGNVIWGIQALAVPDDGAIDQAFGTAVEVTDGFLAAGDVHISSATAGFAPGGTDGAGRLFVFRVYRKAADGGDTLNGDARLLGVQLEYGVTALSA